MNHPTFRSWHNHLLFIVGSLAVGFIVACFTLATDKAQAIFFLIYRHEEWLTVLLCPVTFAFSIWMVCRYFPGTSGSGVPQTIAALHVSNPSHRFRLIGLPIITAKFLLVTLVLLLGGVSLGREGPSVQIGAGIMLFCAQIARTSDNRLFIAAGGAAGFSAAFNAPLAGVAFLFEDLAKRNFRNTHPAMVAIIFLACMGGICITGHYNYYGHVLSEISFKTHWLPMTTIATISGLSGGAFNIAITKGRHVVCLLFNGFGNRRPVMFAAICGLLVALLGIASGGITFGSGYDIGYALLHSEISPSWWQPLAKIAATGISVISGIPGGTISPSLSIGATIGGAVAQLFPTVPISVLVLLAIAGYFAAFTQSPITASVIVLEITGLGSNFLPLLAVSLLSAAISHILFPYSIFDVMADSIVTELKEKVSKSPAAVFDGKQEHGSGEKDTNPA